VTIKCNLPTEPCPEHGYVHGHEAEELRKGIEELTSKIDLEEGPEVRQQLRCLLDRVDARDSVAHLEQKQQCLPRCATCGHLADEHAALTMKCVVCFCAMYRKEVMEYQGTTEPKPPRLAPEYAALHISNGGNCLENRCVICRVKWPCQYAPVPANYPEEK
jgi:hypothetical protein